MQNYSDVCILDEGHHGDHRGHQRVWSNYVGSTTVPAQIQFARPPTLAIDHYAMQEWEKRRLDALTFKERVQEIERMLHACQLDPATFLKDLNKP